MKPIQAVAIFAVLGTLLVSSAGAGEAEQETIPALHALPLILRPPVFVSALKPGKAEGTFVLEYTGRITWSGKPAFPVDVSLQSAGKSIATIRVSDDKPFKLLTDIKPGTYKVYSKVVKASEYWRAFGPVFHIDRDGKLEVVVGEFSNPIFHDKSMRLTQPRHMELVKSRRPLLRLALVEGADYYMVTWSEWTWPDQKLISNQSNLRVTETEYQFSQDVANNRLYGWNVHAYDNAFESHGRELAHSNSYFLTTGANPDARPKPRQAAPNRVWLGVSLRERSSSFANEFYQIERNFVTVLEVIPDSPGIKAGIKVNDVILEYSGVDISTAPQLVRAVGKTKAGTKVRLKIGRAGRMREIEVTIEALPTQRLQNRQSEPPPLRVYCCEPMSYYPPFYSWPANSMQPRGHEPDVIREVVKDLGRTIQFVVLPPYIDREKPRTDVLLRKTADLVISCFTIDSSGKKDVAFSRPYYTDGLGVMVRADSPIRSVDDLAEATIIAWRHTTAYEWVKKHHARATIISTLPKGYTGPPEGLVVDGTADAYVLDRSNLISLSGANKKLRLLPDRLTKKDWGIAMGKDDVELLKGVNRALEQMEKDGRLEQIRQRWIKGWPVRKRDAM